MEPENIVTLLIAAIAAASAYASQRAAARASTNNVQTTSRVDMEKEAYDRARAYDTETIRRQDAEIEELREQIVRMKARITELEGIITYNEHPDNKIVYRNPEAPDERLQPPARS